MTHKMSKCKLRPKTWKPSNFTFLSLYRTINIAIDKSKCVPFLLISEGDKLIVIFSGGIIKLFVKSADLTLSLDSWISLPAKPTTENEGKAFVNVASTTITCALTPSKVAHFNWLTIILLSLESLKPAQNKQFCSNYNYEKHNQATP